MLNDDIKKEAVELVSKSFNNEIAAIEGDPTNTKKDWEVLWDNAKTKVFERGDPTFELEENEKKYEGVIFITYIDQDGELKEEAIVGYRYYDDDGELFEKMNGFGYDRLPPDVQQAFGEREEVVGKWVKTTPEQREIYNAFTRYHRDDSHGYGTWEEYRDDKLGKQEDISIKNVQETDDIASPRETPTIPKDNTIEIS